MKNITVYKVENASISEIELLYDEDQEYYEFLYSQLNCDASEHLEVSKYSNNPFGKKIRSGMLSVKSEANSKYNIDSLYYGSTIDTYKRKKQYLYKENFEQYSEENNVNTNTEISEFQFGNIRLPQEESENIFDVLFWKGLEQTPINFKMIFHICNQFGIQYFTDFYGTKEKNNAKSFAKYYSAFKSKRNIWDVLTENQKQVLQLIKEDYFNLDQSIVKYKKRDLWSLF